MTDLTTLTPAQVDEALSRIWGQQDAIQSQFKKVRGSIERIEARIASGKHYWEDPKTLAHYQQQATDLIREVARLRKEAAPYEAEYERRGRWNRYFLVTNGNGHVHRGTNCSTCYPTTQFGWLVELADKGEDAMIEKFGHVACTVCFPNAPVEELRAAREAALYCPGSGKYVEKPANWRGGYNYRPCPDCGAVVTISKNSATLRKHKAKGGK